MNPLLVGICCLLGLCLVSYQIGVKEGRLQARTEAVVILRQIDRSGIMAGHYAQAILNKYGVKTKIKIGGK